MLGLGSLSPPPRREAGHGLPGDLWESARIQIRPRTLSQLPPETLSRPTLGSSIHHPHVTQ